MTECKLVERSLEFFKKRFQQQCELQVNFKLLFRFSLSQLHRSERDKFIAEKEAYCIDIKPKTKSAIDVETIELKIYVLRGEARKYFHVSIKTYIGSGRIHIQIRVLESDALLHSRSVFISYNSHSCFHLRLLLILITFFFSYFPFFSATTFININCHVHNVKYFFRFPPQRLLLFAPFIIVIDTWKIFTHHCSSRRSAATCVQFLISTAEKLFAI